MEFEEIDHTADWAIRIRARDLHGLFECAARGMFSLLADSRQIDVQKEFEVRLQAIDAETLLIDWLNELLFLAEENEVIFVEFQIVELLEGDNAQMQARVRGGVPAELVKTIKAATFSSLVIQRNADGMTAELVFDV